MDRVHLIRHRSKFSRATTTKLGRPNHNTCKRRKRVHKHDCHRPMTPENGRPTTKSELVGISRQSVSTVQIECISSLI